MFEGLLMGVFGNAIFEIIKFAIKNKFADADDDLVDRIYNCLEEATKCFFEEYHDEFGDANSCFLARQKNIDIIVSHMFYDNNKDLVEELSVEGFDGAKPASKDALIFFVNKLFKLMMNDFRLNQIITEKDHIAEGHEIMDMLKKFIKPTGSVSNSKEDRKDEWVIKDNQGNDTKLIEGRQYVFKFPNIEYRIMFKEGNHYIEVINKNGQKSYYELDKNFNMKDGKLPYELAEYTLIIPEEEVVNKQIFKYPNGNRKETVKLKWNRLAIAVYDKSGELLDVDLRGGWEFKHNEKIILPRKLRTDKMGTD